MSKIKENEKCHYIQSTQFTLDKRFNDLIVIGKGSYGVVCSSMDNKLNKRVAIKKITSMCKYVTDAKHVLREIRLMRYMGRHENIVSLYDLYVRDSADELYIVMELLDSDLHRVLQSKQSLTEDHFRHFFHQLLCGVKYLHDHRIIHRDLKPGNLLVTRDCKLRITDFGLARQRPIGKSYLDPDEDIDTAMTEHVITRWYRPCELMLCPDGLYDYSVDLWSCGCILGEMLCRLPMFPGKNFVHQLSLIFDVIGAPQANEIVHIKNGQAKKFLESQFNKKRINLIEKFPTSSKESLLLLDSLLIFNPDKRLTVDEALNSSFLSGLDHNNDQLHYPDTSIKNNEFQFDFEREDLTRLELKTLIQEEISSFRNEIKTKSKNNVDINDIADELQNSTIFKNIPLNEDLNKLSSKYYPVAEARQKTQIDNDDVDTSPTTTRKDCIRNNNNNNNNNNKDDDNNYNIKRTNREPVNDNNVGKQHIPQSSNHVKVNPSTQVRTAYVQKNSQPTNQKTNRPKSANSTSTTSTLYSSTSSSRQQMKDKIIDKKKGPENIENIERSTKLISNKLSINSNKITSKVHDNNMTNINKMMVELLKLEKKMDDKTSIIELEQNKKPPINRQNDRLLSSGLNPKQATISKSKNPTKNYLRPKSAI
jgi:serine/threonine protein kinase